MPNTEAYPSVKFATDVIWDPASPIIGFWISKGKFLGWLPVKVMILATSTRRWEVSARCSSSVIERLTQERNWFW